jgi:hypothetical protein
VGAGGLFDIVRGKDRCMGSFSYGVSAPVPHGVDGSVVSRSYPVGEYMPKSVEDVRFNTECVRDGVSSSC